MDKILSLFLHIALAHCLPVDLLFTRIIVVRSVGIYSRRVCARLIVTLLYVEEESNLLLSIFAYAYVDQQSMQHNQNNTKIYRLSTNSLENPKNSYKYSYCGANDTHLLGKIRVLRSFAQTYRAFTHRSRSYAHCHHRPKTIRE
jgi:hypothetical protein